MKKILKWCQITENLVIFITFLIMVVAMSMQVINRNIIKAPVSGFEEISKFCMVYMVLLGTELGLRDGTQISVVAFTESLRGKLKKSLEIIAKIIVVLFSVFMFYEGIVLFKQQYMSQQISASLQIPMTIPYASLIIAFGAMVLVQGATLIRMLLDFNKEDIVEQPAHQEGKE